MPQSRRPRIFLVASLLGTVLIAGPQFLLGQGTTDSKTKQNEPRHTDEKSDIVELNQITTKLGIEVDKLSELVRSLSGSTTSSPLKVRGGAITFRSTKDQFFLDHDGNHCIKIDAADNNYILLKNVTQTQVPIPADVKLSKDTVPITTPLGSKWQVDIFGRVPTGDAESGNGIQIKPTSTCNKTFSGISLTVESNNSDFYKTMNASQDDDGSYIERFLDKTSTSGGNIGCDADPTQGHGDRDLCEHIWSVYVSLTPQGDPKNHADYAFRCVNGNCEIEIGKPK